MLSGGVKSSSSKPRNCTRPLHDDDVVHDFIGTYPTGSISGPNSILAQFEDALRGSAAGRVLSALAEARRKPEETASGTPAHPEKGSGPGSSWPRLLPCHLPSLPGWFAQPEAKPRRSRRTQDRLACRRLSWRIAEWQLAYFTTCELSWPSDAVKAVRGLGPHRVSGEQMLAF